MSISMKNLEDRVAALERKGSGSSWTKGSNSNGYWMKETSSGLTIQWGVDPRNNYYMWKDLPIPFTTNTYTVMGCGHANSEIGVCTWGYTTTGFNIRAGGGLARNWLAIGY